MTDVLAQKNEKLTKEQKREYRKRGKELQKEFKEKYKNPEQFKQLKDENANAKRKVDSLTVEISILKEKNDANKEELDLLRRTHSDEQERLAQLEKVISQARKRGIPSPGTFYAVQIGTVSPQELGKILANDSSVDLNVDTDEKGNDIFILGWYDNVQRAVELQKNIRIMGFKIANLVAFKDGKPLLPDKNGKFQTNGQK
jgi:hypothetical protein